MKILALLLFLLSSYTTIHAQDNDRGERRSVKMLADGFKPNDSVWHSTVHELVNKKDFPKYPGNSSPRLEIERRVVELTAILVGYKRERDSDIHLVLQDLSTGETMNGEIPLGKYVPLEYGSQFDSLRLNLQVAGKAPSPTHPLRRLRNKVFVTVRGILFVDRLHRTKVEAKNGIECHPILSIRFLP